MTSVIQETPAQPTREQLMERLRTFIPAMGIRAAAREIGISEDTAKSWALRYGMTAHPVVQEALQRIPRGNGNAIQLHPDAPNGGIIMANSMADDALHGRAAALRATRKALVHMAELPAVALTDKDTAQTLHVHVKSASIAGGYGADSRPDAPGKAFGARRDALVVDAEFESVELVEHPEDDPMF